MDFQPPAEISTQQEQKDTKIIVAFKEFLETNAGTPLYSNSKRLFSITENVEVNPKEPLAENTDQVEEEEEQSGIPYISRTYYDYLPNSRTEHFKKRDSIKIYDTVPRDLKFYYYNESGKAETDIAINEDASDLEYNYNAEDYLHIQWTNDKILDIVIEPRRNIPLNNIYPTNTEDLTKFVSVLNSELVQETDEEENRTHHESKNERESYLYIDDDSIERLLLSGEPIVIRNKPRKNSEQSIQEINDYNVSYDKEKKLIVVKRYVIDSENNEILLDTITASSVVDKKLLAHYLNLNKLVEESSSEDTDVDNNWRNLPIVRQYLGISWVPTTARNERNQAYIKQKVESLPNEEIT